jgi:pantoate--beta-alanine ligase
VVSIFVNPTQFAAHEDLAGYPRDEAGDLAKLASVSTDLIWSPQAAEMYPEGFATRVVPAGAALDLEGEFRPQHFSGVATVCCKLFSQVMPDFAVFGEKDYQQLCVIRQMVRDLDLPLAILALPTVREVSGLALSSRNAYLSADERKIAPALNGVLREVADRVGKGEATATAVAEARRALQRAGFQKVDYVEVRDALTLESVEPKSERKGRALAAAWLGRTRLIDNVEVPGLHPRQTRPTR